MSGSLSGKVALVTGAARGIGRAVAERLAKDGAQVAVMDNVQSNAKDAFTADVTSRAQVADTVKAVLSRFGRIDILVNNAGIGKPVSFMDTTDEDWSRIVDVNLRGYFVVGQEVARAMIAQGSNGQGQSGGRIVNVASPPTRPTPCRPPTPRPRAAWWRLRAPSPSNSRPVAFA